MPNRKKPEVFLEEIERENQNRTRGQLKIFFGYAAGVGKTYEMLETAREAKAQGVDLVAGYIEPHTRPATMALLEGLEVLPTQAVTYRGITLQEFDLDAALERHPEVILVDELAHTNAEGCRHAKRYQDIDELLKAGINVWTTVNVQHIESLNDIVSGIIGTIVRERIPDRVFDGAAQVELVDIEPEELIERLHKGKIYKEDRASRALEHFFTPENLVALREIALRRMADRVNRIMKWDKGRYTEEHILVCLSAAPSNARIIRTAARMADAFHGRFSALYVETPNKREMSAEDQDRLHVNVHLAEQLGAGIETVQGVDIPFQIAEFARLSSVSKIVLGRSNTKKKFIFGRPSFTERLTELAPSLDIYIIPDSSADAYREQRRKLQKIHKGEPFNLRDGIITLSILVGITAINLFFHQLGFTEANIITIYILGVLMTAVLTEGKIWCIGSSLVSVLIFNFFFTEPYYSLKAYGPDYPITFVIMFLAAFITGSLTTRIKEQARLSALMAYRTRILLETNQMMQKERDSAGIASVAAKQLTRLLEKPVVFYRHTEEGLSAPQIVTPEFFEGDTAPFITEHEQAVAHWAYTNNKHAGASTDNLGNAQCLYLAIRGSDGVYGVVGIVLLKDRLDTFENNLVLSLLSECGLSMERESLSRKRAKAALQAKNEQLRADLLRSISHDLRTPLTSISGNAGMLMEQDCGLDAEKRRQMATDIYDDAQWLISLVENLLAVTRIEDGTIELHLEPELMEEIIAEALRHIGRKAEEHRIRVLPCDKLIMAKMDARLIVQVVSNIVGNAVKYTEKNSEIIISMKQEKGEVQVDIADDGPGIPDRVKKHIFDMFYTTENAPADSRRSLGLGLALCKSIILAHGGRIDVIDNVPRGTRFRFFLKAEEVDFYE